MDLATFVAFAVVTSPLVGCVLLTALGSRRRGDATMTAAVSAVFFPVAWAVWYVHDRRGSRRS